MEAEFEQASEVAMDLPTSASSSSLPAGRGGRAEVLVMGMWKHPLHDPLRSPSCKLHADSRSTQSPKAGLVSHIQPGACVVREVLLKHSQAHSCGYCLWSFGATMEEQSRATEAVMAFRLEIFTLALGRSLPALP